MNIAMIGQKGIAAGEKAGGIERHVQELATRLAEREHRVFVYARAKYHPSKPKKIGLVNLVYQPTIYRKHTEAIIHTFFSTIHAMRKKCDVIHYHGVGPATLSWIPRIFRRKATVVVTFHSQDQFHQKWNWFARKFLAFAERIAVMAPQACITVSHALQVYCREVFDREAIFIPNGATVKEVTKTDKIEEMGLEPREYLLNVGRLVHQKGIQYLVEAFRNIETDKKLIIVGASGFDMDYERKLRKLAKGDDRIQFVGFKSGETLDQLYAHAYLYVHPSESEGLPLVILEAMSFGQAPLVSDIAPNVEAIHHVGTTFESTNADDLKAKLEKLLGDEQLVEEHREEARAVVDVHFNWKTIAERTEAVYLSARH